MAISGFWHWRKIHMGRVRKLESAHKASGSGAAACGTLARVGTVLAATGTGAGACARLGTSAFGTVFFGGRLISEAARVSGKGRKGGGSITVETGTGAAASA